MRTRRIYKYIDDNGREHVNVVWFGATGKTIKGYDNVKWDSATAIYDDKYGQTIFDDNKSSFSEKQKSVVDALTQQLSVIRGELWYAANYGLPLFEKNKTKSEFDAVILNIITRHPDVNHIISFNSSIDNKTYHCNVNIQSVYGQISINL